MSSRLAIEEEGAGSFEPRPAKFASLAEKTYADCWLRWDLQDNRSVASLSLKSRFEPGEAKAFLLDLFNSPVVRETTTICKGKGSMAPLSTILGSNCVTGTRIRDVKFETLATKVTSMAFFDRLIEDEGGRRILFAAKEDAAAGSSDSKEEKEKEAPLIIRKRLEDVIDGVTIADELRDALANPDTEHGGLFAAEEERELLYRIFKHVVIGGGSCQYEDTANSYLNATRDLYKDLVSVARDSSTGKIAVQSHVFAVEAIFGTPAAIPGTAPGSGKQQQSPLFPKENDRNVLWVVVTPGKFTVSCYYSAWLPFW